MKKGFEIIKTRALNDMPNLTELEISYSLTLPPLYKLFCNYFTGGKLHYEEYIINNDLTNLHYCVGSFYAPKGLDGANIGLTSIYHLEEVFENRKTLAGYGDEDIEKGLIRIADIGMGGGIFVGTHQGEEDLIFLSIWDKEPLYEKIADNIFQFIQGIESVNIPENELIGGIRFNQLYKNWGEDYWRVKEQQQ
jgi:hypothetical protein